MSAVNVLKHFLGITKMKLYEIEDPTKIDPASIQCDEVLNKIQHNLGVLTEMIQQVGQLVIELEHMVNNNLLLEMNKLTEEQLKKLAVPKSDKMRYARLLIADDIKNLDEAKNKRRWYENQLKVYYEFINILKKIRTIPGE